MDVRIPREDRADVLAMVPFSEMLECIHFTAQQLAAVSHQNATVAWGLVLAVWPLRGSGLISIMHAVNSSAKLILRLMLFSVIGGDWSLGGVEALRSVS